MTANPTSWTADLAARYELLEEAGRGGMGVVYKARDRETGELVALKILKPEIAADRSASERFINEVRLSRRITHKNVCRVYEFSRAGATAYLSMEFVEGESLRSILDRMGAVTLRKGIQIARQMCAALAEAHQQGIIHRDLKPENVMIDRAGNVKVMDFGIARLLDASVTATGGIIGTPAYMAPEQAEGRELDARTDIYSAGLILYEIFTGRVTFSGDTPVAVALKHIRDTPVAPRVLDATIPWELEAVILRCLAKDPADRFQSVEELDAALAAVPTNATTGAFFPPAQTLPPEGGSHRISGGAQTLPPEGGSHRISGGAQTLPPEGGSHRISEGPGGAPPPPHVASAFRRKARPLIAAAAAILVLAALAGAYLKWGRHRQAIPFTGFALSNGLQVLLAEDHSAPTVAVAVLYNVGARDDPPGRDGLAHLFEHMMFSGSLNVGNGEHQALVTLQGGSPNGQTFIDHTQFWETLPANQLDLALFLEADRMRSLRLDEARLQTVRGTVIAERQQRIENAAYGRVIDTLYQTAYDIRAYKRPSLGTPEGLQAVTLQEVTDFFKIYYAPNNAVLVVVGDFKPGDARAKIENYFQHIAPQPPPPVPDLAEAEQTQERRARIEDPFAPAPRVYFAYKMPPGRAEDWEALEVLSTILGDGESSRLHKTIVREMEAGSEAGGIIEQRPGPGLLLIAVAPALGKDEASIVAAVDGVVAKVRDEGVSDAEVARARNRIRLSGATLLQQTVRRAMLLGEYQLKYGGAAAVDTHLARLDAVTPQAVQRAAATYLRPEHRTVVSVVPGSRRPGTPATAPAVTSAPERLNRAPISKDVLRISLPRPKETTLDNGLTLLVAEDRRVPLVSVRFEIRGAGALHDPADLPGLAFGVAAMLRQGTATRTSRDISEQLDTYGAALSAGQGADPAVIVVQATGLSDTFGAWFPIAADAVQHASFPADELSLMKRRLAADWRSRRSDPGPLSFDLYDRVVYGPAAPPRIAPESFAALTSDRMKAWHLERYAPQNTIVSMAGALAPADAEARVREALGGWRNNGFSERLPQMPPPPGRRAHVLDRPGSVQTSIVVGAATVDRVNADYLPLVVANRVLGGSAASRLFVRLRDQEGITFAASSVLYGFKHGGDWRAYGDMNAARTGQAIDGVLAEMQRIATEPVPAPEMDQAKRSIVASFALTLEQLSQLVSYMAARRAYGLSADYWERYPEKIMAVSPEDAQRAAAKYLDASRLQIVAVGDAAMLAPLLASRAPVVLYGADGAPK